MRKRIVKKILSEKPLIVVIDSNLSDEYLDKLASIPITEKSHGGKTIKKADGTVETVESSSYDDKRSSYTLYTNKQPEYLELTEYIIDAISKEIGYQYNLNDTSPIQLTRYIQGDHFSNHCDFINQRKDGVRDIDKDRVATAILYINDECVGGETIFPELGISVSPKKGQILYFRYGKEFTLEERLNTIHSGSKVVDGEKIIAVQLFTETENERQI